MSFFMSIDDRSWPQTTAECKVSLFVINRISYTLNHKCEENKEIPFGSLPVLH